MDEAPRRSVAEEAANSITHALGFILSIVAAISVVRLSPSLSPGTAVTCGVFVATMMVLYALSTCSHVVKRSRLQDRLRAWDQGAVYLLIAGTYTPFVFACLAFPWREVGLSLLWSAAGAGFVAKVFVGHRVNRMQRRSYLLLGWVPALFLFYRVPVVSLIWMAVGGLSYTVGTLFLKADRRVPYFHAMWHLFVVIGSASHCYAIYHFLVAPEFN